MDISNVKDTSNSYRKKLLNSTVLGLGFESMDIMVLSFVLSSIISDFHISSTVGGTISSITNIGMLIGGIIFGILADKHGRVPMFKYTILIFSIATIIMGFSPNIQSIFILRFIAGVGAGGEYGIIMSMIAEGFRKEERGKINSYTTVGGQVGNIIIALAAFIILPMSGWNMMFIIFGLIPIPLVFYINKNLKESDEWLETRNKTKGKVSLKELFITPKKTIITFSLILMTSVQCSGYYGLINWMPSILQKQLNLSAANSSLWTISIIIGICFGMLTFGRLMDKFGATLCYSVFLIISAGSVFIYVYAQNPIIILIGGAIVGFFTNGMMAGYGALISSFYPATIRSTANNTVFNAGRAIGGLSPIAIGYILDKYNLTYVMIFLSILYIISLFCVLNLRRIGTNEN